MTILEEGHSNDPAYQVPVGCKNQSESTESLRAYAIVQPYEITTVQPVDKDQDLKRLSSKYIWYNKDKSISENESTSENFELQNINCPKENDYYHIYENGEIYSQDGAGKV